MGLEAKVRAVEYLYLGLDEEIKSFQASTKLSCLSGCGKCCTYASIEAAPLEFLPWAFHLFLNGTAETTLTELKANKSLTCYNYSPLTTLDTSKGSCVSYQYRGLICRLFGYGANRDKLGELRLATCMLIKENQIEFYVKAQAQLKEGLEVPIFTDYYMKLSQIDFQLTQKILPINTALKLAIEEVLQYYAYRPLPSGHKDIA